MRHASRRGISIVEVGVGAAMLAVLLTLLGQMFVLVRLQSRQTAERADLMLTLENAMEELTAAPWNAIDDQAIASWKPSEAARRRWPRISLTGQVTGSTDPVEAKQLTLNLASGATWQYQPLSLTTWVYRAR